MCSCSFTQYKLKLPKEGSINHLQEEMARLSGLDKSKVLCVCGVCVSVSIFVILHVCGGENLSLSLHQMGLYVVFHYECHCVYTVHVCSMEVSVAVDGVSSNLISHWQRLLKTHICVTLLPT